MQAYTERKMQRKNFLLSLDLVNRAKVVAEDLKLDFSELVRVALGEFIGRREQERAEKELADACKNYREFNKQFSTEWAQFETRIE